MAQLGHSSDAVKDSPRRKALVDDLLLLIGKTCPGIVYTHNPFDKHATHIAVMQAVLTAIRQLPPDKRPKKVFGCEVWRGLDWLPDEFKVIQDVSAHPELAKELNSCFQSQIAGGKRYDLAVEGRRLANATFLDSHVTDSANRVSLSVDLTELIHEGGPSLETFVEEVLGRFNESIRTGIHPGIG
jgi:LmbE family N-acetylglucosaminyl deacetylase